MTWLDFEVSLFKSAPQELYVFTCGTEKWGYASGDVVNPPTALNDLTDLIFEKRAIERSAIEQAKDLERAAVTLTVPRDLPVAVQFIAAPPEGFLFVDIYRQQMNAEDDGTNYTVYWSGHVSSVLFAGSTASMTCDPTLLNMRSEGNQATFSPQCRHRVYGKGCKLHEADFTTDCLFYDIAGDGVRVYCPDLDTARNIGGTFAMTYNGVEYRRMITDIATGTGGEYLLHLMRGLPAVKFPTLPLVGGARLDASIIMNCPRTKDACQNTFGNVINFGGFPWKPGKNPFKGDSVF